MSAIDLLKKPLDEITEFLKSRHIELKPTKFNDVYLIKFSAQTDVNDPLINNLKGLIFNHKTGEILSLTYPVPVEFKDLTQEDQEKLIKYLTKSQYVVQEALDGTLFRYAYFPEQNQWILSTNSKEDANDAYWMNGISLANQFASINSKIDLESLNKEYVYMFIMCHPLNVIVVNHEKSTIFHVSTYDKTSMTEIECDIGIPKPPIFNLTPEEIKTKITTTTEKPVKSAGFLILVKNDKSVSRYRFENRNYSRAKELRGNSNNIDYTILDLFKEKGESTLLEFLEYYPIYKSEYLNLIHRIAKLAAKLYREYGWRYKDHRTIRVHPRHHKFLNEIHQIVFRDTLKVIGKTVQFEDIHRFLMGQPTAKLLYLINYIYDQKK